MLSQQAVAIWHRLDDKGHMRLVEGYLREAGTLKNVHRLDRSSRRLLSDPLYAIVGESIAAYTSDGTQAA